MTKKTKTKNKSKKPASKRIARQKNYEAHYLALVLIGLLLVEGYLGTTTSLSDWQQGVAVLDMSQAVAQTSSDLAVVFQPVTNTIDGVNQFYAIAANEMAQVLDLSGSDNFADLGFVTDGVYNFYQQASVQMAGLLDVSPENSWPARVAGASVTSQ